MHLKGCLVLPGCGTALPGAAVPDDKVFVAGSIGSELERTIESRLAAFYKNRGRAITENRTACPIALRDVLRIGIGAQYHPLAGDAGLDQSPAMLSAYTNPEHPRFTSNAMQPLGSPNRSWRIQAVVGRIKSGDWVTRIRRST